MNIKFDIIALSETWLSPRNKTINGFHGYNQLDTFRETKTGGGVSLLIKNNITFQELPLLSRNNDFIESVFAEIELKDKSVIVGCIYRPPDKSSNADGSNRLKSFIEEMTLLISSLNETKKDVYIMGDFNIDLLHYNTHQLTTEFVNMMMSGSFMPLINHPTRVSEDSATIIDNIFSNCIQHDQLVKGILPTDVSDHFSLFAVDADTNHSSSKPIEHLHQHVINTETLGNFSKGIQNINWDTVLTCESTDNAFNLFSEKFVSQFKKHIPVKSRTIRNCVPKKPWITENLLRSISFKNKLFRDMTVYGKDVDRTYYKQYKNKLLTLIRNAEKEYYKKRLELYKNNLSKMWSTLNEVINRKKISKCKTIFRVNNTELKDPQEIADQFNKFFNNAPKDIYKKFPKCTEDPSHHVKCNINSIYLNPVTEGEILKILNKFQNKSSGHDNINPITVKHVRHHILRPLVHICNLSFTEGIFPSDLKIAKVVPIYKKGDKTLLSNYRPVSVLPAFSKILERLMYNRIVDFLERFQILNENQYGFRKNRSTHMALSVVVEKFHEALDRNEFMVGLFIDLSRAFDTISHDILSTKLEKYGIRGRALDWIKNYLSHRKQYVSFENTKSYTSSIDIGVPQGSILGPLLFILYVNDLHNITDRLLLVQFADDTSIFATGSSLPQVVSTIEHEMQYIIEWLKNNKLSLNVAKTNFMILTSRGKKYDDDVRLRLDGETIECVTETKFLGVVLDNHLTFKCHIDNVVNKLSKGIGILCRARHSLYANYLKTLYTSLIQPYVNYCLIIWGHTYTSYIHRIQMSLKKIVRIITGSEYRAHTAELFSKLQIMDVYQLYKFQVSAFVYRCLRRELPNYFCEYFSHNITSRLSHNLQTRFCSKKVCEFSVKFTGPKFWNEIPIGIKKLNSQNHFKSKLKSHIMSIVA